MSIVDARSYRELYAIGAFAKRHNWPRSASENGQDTECWGDIGYPGDFNRHPSTNSVAGFRKWLKDHFSESNLSMAWVHVETELANRLKKPRLEKPSSYAAEGLHFGYPTCTTSSPITNEAPQMTKETPASGSIDAIIASIAREAARGACDEARVRDIAAEVMAVAAPRIIEVRQPKLESVRVSGAHPMFEKVLKLAAQGLNVLLVGPAGCGKTKLAHMVADALQRPFGSVSYSAGASESWLLGRLLPTGENGRFEYQASRFCELYQLPSVFLHDELDAADPNMLLTLNSALANGGFDNPVSGARLVRHVQAVNIGSANTFGTGAGALYVGRSQLDAATLDRWYVVNMDYDAAFEDTCAPANVVSWVRKLRERVAANKLRRVVSTRMIQKMGAGLSAGLTFSEVCADATTGWTADELAKVS